jgi:NAD+ synthase (glutamine-hydrolysing)
VVRMFDRWGGSLPRSPPGIKISTKAFGRDRRLPITNRYEGRAEDAPKRRLRALQ